MPNPQCSLPKPKISQVNPKVKQLRGQKGELKKLIVRITIGVIKKCDISLMLAYYLVNIITMEPSQCSTGRSSMKHAVLCLPFVGIILKCLKSCVILSVSGMGAMVNRQLSLDVRPVMILDSGFLFTINWLKFLVVLKLLILIFIKLVHLLTLLLNTRLKLLRPSLLPILLLLKRSISKAPMS